MAPHDAARFTGHARAEGVALEDEDVGFAAVGEGVGDGQAFEAAADDQKLGRVRHLRILRSVGLRIRRSVGESMSEGGSGFDADQESGGRRAS